jgi:hypothetical protein
MSSLQCPPIFPPVLDAFLFLFSVLSSSTPASHVCIPCVLTFPTSQLSLLTVPLQLQQRWFDFPTIPGFPPQPSVKYCSNNVRIIKHIAGSAASAQSMFCCADKCMPRHWPEILAGGRFQRKCRKGQVLSPLGRCCVHTSCRIFWMTSLWEGGQYQLLFSFQPSTISPTRYRVSVST